MAMVNHPIAGEVNVPDELFVGDDQAAINSKVNQYLAGVVADALQKEGVDLSSVAFSESGKRIGSESIRGLAELGTDQVTTTGTQDFMNLVYQQTNPYSSFFGGLAGGAGDPTNVLPEPFTKIKMLKRVFGPLLDSKSYLWEAIKKDATTGALFGALAPEREDYDETRLNNIMYSAAGSAGFGAIRGTLGKLSGAKTDSEIKAILDDLSAEETRQLNEALDSAGRNLNQAEVQGPMLPAEGPPRQLFEEANFVGPKQQAELVGPPLPRAETDIEAMRFDYQQKQDIARQVDEMDAEVKTLPSADQQAGIFKSIKEADKEVKYLDDELARLNREYNILSNKKRTDGVRKAMDVKQRQINKTKALQQQRINERDFAQESVNRFKELKAARKEVQQYRAAEKKGESYTPSFVKPLEAPKKPVVRQKQEAVVPQQVEAKQPAEPFVGPQRRVVVQTPPEMPAPQAAQVAPQVAPTQVVSDAQVAPRPKSLSAGGANNMDLPAEETQRILNMNVNSRAAQSTPPATGRQGKVESEADFVRASVRQELERQYGIEGAQKITRQDVIDEANQVRGMVNRMEAEGSMEGGMPAYLLEQMSRNGMLEPHEALLLEEVAAEATWQMSKVATKIRSLSRTPSKDGVAEMQRVQELANQIDTFNRLREWERYGEDAKRKASALLRSYRDANRIAQENMKDLQAGRIVNQLFFGVDC